MVETNENQDQEVRFLIRDIATHTKAAGRAFEQLAKDPTRVTLVEVVRLLQRHLRGAAQAADRLIERLETAKSTR